MTHTHETAADAEAVEACPYAEITTDDLARLARLATKVKLEAPVVTLEAFRPGFRFKVTGQPLCTVSQPSWPAGGVRCRLTAVEITSEGIKVEVHRQDKGDSQRTAGPTDVSIDSIKAVDVPL